MKFALLTDEISQQLEPAVAISTSFGIDAWEIRSVNETAPLLLSHAEIEAVLATTDKLGVEVCLFASPCFKSPLDETSFRDDLQVVNRSLAVARAVGATQVRMFTGLRREEQSPSQCASYIGRVLREVDVGPETQIVFETGTESSCPSARPMVEFLSRLSDVWEHEVGVLWDPGNSVFAGAIAPSQVLQERTTLGDHVRHVHMKNPAGVRTEYVHLADGLIDWLSVLELLANDGFDGYVGLETHWRHERTLDFEQRMRPWGTEFSAGGAQTTIACLNWVRDHGFLTAASESR